MAMPRRTRCRSRSFWRRHWGPPSSPAWRPATGRPPRRATTSFTSSLPSSRTRWPSRTMPCTSSCCAPWPDWTATCARPWRTSWPGSRNCVSPAAASWTGTSSRWPTAACCPSCTSWTRCARTSAGPPSPPSCVASAATWTVRCRRRSSSTRVRTAPRSWRPTGPSCTPASAPAPAAASARASTAP